MAIRTELNLRLANSPGALAGRITATVLYGSQHPYGYSDLGTEASVKAMTREDMVAFWQSHFAPDNAALIVAGSITAEELKALAEKQFGGWQGRRLPQTELGAPATTAARPAAATGTAIRMRRLCLPPPGVDVSTQVPPQR